MKVNTVMTKMVSGLSVDSLVRSILWGQQKLYNLCVYTQSVMQIWEMKTEHR